MHLPRIAVGAMFAVGLVTLPPATAKAQYYPPPCNPFPLFWPVCAATVVVGAAATIATAPIRAIAGPPYPYPRSYPYAGYGPYAAPPPSYSYPPPYYGARPSGY